MVEQFTKFGWIVQLKDKPALAKLKTFKKWVTTHNIPTILESDTRTSLKIK